MDERLAHQFNLTLDPPNQTRTIPEKKQHEAIQKLAELVVHYFKTHRQISNDKGEHNNGK